MRKFGKWSLFILVDFIILALLLVGPIDRTGLKEQSFYQEMMKSLDTVRFMDHGSDSLKIGWSKVSITPDHTMPMAGYRPRSSFDSVHDSLFANVITLESSSAIIYFISVDLLVFPPSLKEKLKERLPSNDKPFFLFLAATHTHNGVGGWDDSLLGHFSVGKYNGEWVDNTADKIFGIAKKSTTSSLIGKVAYKEWSASKYVGNRLSPGASTDGIIRGLHFEKKNGEKALLITYSGHPTNIGKSNLGLSGDYPSALVKELTTMNYDFAMFMAGMVGSHQIENIDGKDYELCENIGSALAASMENENASEELSSRLKTVSINILHGPSQLRIAKNWKIRDWVFSAVSHPLNGKLDVVSIGEVLLIGTPCDFSGELFVESNLQEFATSRNRKLMITSFNGGYTGYITHDAHYDTRSREEVRMLNWVGPYFGAYYTEMIKRIVIKSTE